MKFYIATGEVRKRLLGLDAAREIAMKARRKLIKRFKAAGSVSRGQEMLGLVFKNDPPPPWAYSVKFSKAVSNTHIPDRSADGKAVRKEMEATRDPADGFVVAEILKVEPMFLGRYTQPCFGVYQGKVIVGLDNRSSDPKGCKRVSDLEYEKLLKATMKTKGLK